MNVLTLTPRERCYVALEVLDGFADQSPHCSLGGSEVGMTATWDRSKPAWTAVLVVAIRRFLR